MMVLANYCPGAEGLRSSAPDGAATPADFIYEFTLHTTITIDD